MKLIRNLELSVLQIYSNQYDTCNIYCLLTETAKQEMKMKLEVNIEDHIKTVGQSKLKSFFYQEPLT